jgi:hypothetical protein
MESQFNAANTIHRLAVVVVPIRDNSGRPFPDVILARFRADLHSACEGFSYHEIRGEWRDQSGRIYFDESLRFEIADANLTELRRLLSKWTGLLGQEFLYLDSRHLATVEFIGSAASKQVPSAIDLAEAAMDDGPNNSAITRLPLPIQSNQQRKENNVNDNKYGNAYEDQDESNGVGFEDQRLKHESIRPRGHCAGHLRHPRECTCGRERTVLRHGRRFSRAASCARCLRASASSVAAPDYSTEASND